MSTKQLEKGALVISLDTELAWGRIVKEDRFSYYPYYSRTKKVMERLLDLFNKYAIPATWAIVGRMVEKEPGRAEPIQTFYPSITDKTLYADQDLHQENNSWLCFPEIIEKIQAASTAHEIGSHTYAHILFNRWHAEKESDSNQVEKDFSAAQKVWDSYQLSPQSFIYPRNAIGYTDVLASYGYKVFRGPNISRYRRFPKQLNKLFDSLDMFSPIAPITVLPTSKQHNLVDLPGSMHFKVLHYSYRQYVPFYILKQKALLGLKRAISRKEVFHLWFHPFDFSYKSEKHFQAFEAVLAKAAKLRESNRLNIKTMGAFSPELM